MRLRKHRRREGSPAPAYLVPCTSPLGCLSLSFLFYRKRPLAQKHSEGPSDLLPVGFETEAPWRLGSPLKPEEGSHQGSSSDNGLGVWVCFGVGGVVPDDRI